MSDEIKQPTSDLPRIIEKNEETQNLSDELDCLASQVTKPDEINQSTSDVPSSTEKQEKTQNLNIELVRSESQLTIDEVDMLYEAATNSSKPLPPMGDGRPYPPLLGSRQPYLVTFDGPDDVEHPYNYSLGKKCLYSLPVGLAAFTLSLGSAMFSEATPEIMVIYHVGWEVGVLTTSVFILGFAFGPIIWGPLSELFGRKLIMTVSTFGSTCFSFAVATAHNIETIVICRFFTAFMGSAAFVVAPAVLADMFQLRTRGRAMTIFAMILFGGPLLAPILGGFIVRNHKLGWRWTTYVCGMIGSLALVLIVFCLGETHHPVILARRAEELRRRTRNWGIYAAHEDLRLSIDEIVTNNIARPVKMLFTEPILFFASLYNGFIYAMIYSLLTVIPLIFEVGYGFKQGNAELPPYISMIIGEFVGVGILAIFENGFSKIIDRDGKLSPEKRLQPMMIGGVTFVIGILWLCWTAHYHSSIHWIVPAVGSSALAANTFIRSTFAAAFPLFSRQMFVNLTTRWAGTLLGGLGLILVPIPFIFSKYGRTLRNKSAVAYKD
ncbi:FLU1 Major facilitator superfamily multidrug transporter FLU1 [Candida maltosa Xu316]